MERDSVEQAFDRYADLVYRLAFARVKSRSDADDVLQDVFVRLLRTAKVPESEEHLKALLIRITLNCSKSLLTGAWFRRTAPLDEETASETMPNGETLDAVLRLPLRYRTVIHLHYYCGYSAEETAELLSEKPATVRSQLARARIMLKKDLEGAEF